MAAVDYFLKIDGIEGESTDDKHKNEIQLESWSFGASNAIHFDSRLGGGGAGKVSMGDLHFVAVSSKASPKLFLACCGGDHIPKAVLTMRRAGKDQQEYWIWTMTKVGISNYSSGGHAGSATIPSDQFALAFSKIEMEYKPQDTGGKLAGGVKAGWNVMENKKV